MKNKITAFTLTLILVLSASASSAFAYAPFNFDPFNFVPSNFVPNNFVPNKYVPNDYTPKDSAPKDTASPTNSNFEKKVAELVNVERQKNGLPALYLDSRISDVARTKSKDMADNNYFAHQSPTYGSAGNMLLKFGITWSAWGENIASGQKSPEEVVRQWMNSPSHRENILSPNFALIGVGYCTNSSGKTFWTQMFINDEKYFKHLNAVIFKYQLIF